MEISTKDAAEIKINGKKSVSETKEAGSDIHFLGEKSFVRTEKTVKNVSASDTSQRGENVEDIAFNKGAETVHDAADNAKVAVKAVAAKGMKASSVVGVGSAAAIKSPASAAASVGKIKVSQGSQIHTALDKSASSHTSNNMSGAGIVTQSVSDAAQQESRTQNAGQTGVEKQYQEEGRKSAVSDMVKTAEKVVEAKIVKKAAVAVKDMAASFAKNKIVLIAGGAALTILPVICVVVIIVSLLSSYLGVLFSDELTSSDSQYSIRSVVAQITEDYITALVGEKDEYDYYDEVEVYNNMTAWREVLAVYAVKYGVDSDGSVIVGIADDDTYELLSEVFWDMTSVGSQLQEDSVTETQDDGTITVTAVTTLLVYGWNKKTVDEIADYYNFTDEQCEYLEELLGGAYDSLWAQLCYDDSDAAADVVYSFLRSEMGLNRAAACGIMSNISTESGFNYNALGDNGTSYGICQWHEGRWDRLVEFCESNGYSAYSLEGQLYYLKYELETSYSYIYSYLLSVDDDIRGCYDAGYYFCLNFERPSGGEQSAKVRGSNAVSRWWRKYTE